MAVQKPQDSHNQNQFGQPDAYAKGQAGKKQEQDCQENYRNNSLGIGFDKP